MKIIEKDITGSTHADAIELADRGAEHMTVIWTHRQTAGRGTNNRSWTSIEGNVFWSIILRPQPDWPSYANLVFVNALAVRAAILNEIREADGIFLKWPNDIIFSEKKIAGSLLESKGGSAAGQPEWVIIGTGINVVDHPEGADMIYPPTSLHHLGYTGARRESLIGHLNAEIQKQIGFWLASGFDAVRREYLKHAFRLGQDISVGRGADKSTYETGVFDSIGERGELILRFKDGRTKPFHSSDVVVPRQT